MLMINAVSGFGSSSRIIIPATVDFRAVVNTGSDGTSFTSSSHNIGTVTADRKVVVAAYCPSNSGPQTVASITVGGESCSLGVEQSTGTGSTSIWYIDDPDSSLGTAEDIITTVNVSSRAFFIATFDVKGAKAGGPSSTDTDSSTGGNHSLSITVPKGGVCICNSGQNIGLSTTYTWSGGVTEDYDDTGESNNLSSGASVASAAGASLTVTIDPTQNFTTAGGSAGLAWAA